MVMCQNGKDYNQTTSCTGNIASNNIHTADIIKCIVQENIHITPNRRDFFLGPPPPHLSSIFHPDPLQEIPVPSEDGV